MRGLSKRTLDMCGFPFPALDSVFLGPVYVMGGLVDETVIKKLTLDGANERGFKTRRLPVIEYMRRIEGRANYSTVYSINQGAVQKRCLLMGRGVVG